MLGLTDFLKSTGLDKASAYRRRAASKRRRGDTEGAIADHTEAIRLDPASADTFFLRGFTRRDKGDWKGAIIDYDEAIRLDPQHANAHATRANARRMLGDLPGARADADKAVRIDPQNLLGFNNRGLIRYHQNDLVGAADDHGRAIRIDPTFVLAWYHRGRTRFYLGDTEGAIADYDEGIRLAPGDSDLYVARANARRSAGDLGGALDDYAAARRLGANGILGNICVTRFRLGQRAAAAQDCALARQTAGPGDDQPFAAQAGVLLLDGDLGGAGRGAPPRPAQRLCLAPARPAALHARRRNPGGQGQRLRPGDRPVGGEGVARHLRPRLVPLTAAATAPAARPWPPCARPSAPRR
jgi:tetratricopeptide (TPR) repeat protein